MLERGPGSDSDADGPQVRTKATVQVLILKPVVHRCYTGFDSDTGGPQVGTGATVPVQVLILTQMVHRCCTGCDSDADGPHVEQQLLYRF